MKTAVAGIGVIGRVHVEVLRELGYAPAAVCDVIPERRESVAGAKGYGDFSEMLEKERPDVVHICTPHMLHADMIVEALGRDINVLCEKPLCIKAEDIPRDPRSGEKFPRDAGRLSAEQIQRVISVRKELF